MLLMVKNLLCTNTGGIPQEFMIPRNYKVYMAQPILDIDKALEEISQNRGILYDPAVLDVCMKIINKNGFKLM